MSLGGKKRGKKKKKEKMVIKTELVVSSIKNAIFESRKSRGTPIERFIKQYRSSIHDSKLLFGRHGSFRPKVIFFLSFFFFKKCLVKRRTLVFPPLCVEVVWSRSIAFETREKRSDPTTRVSTIEFIFFFTVYWYWKENEI